MFVDAETAANAVRARRAEARAAKEAKDKAIAEATSQKIDAFMKTDKFKRKVEQINFALSTRGKVTIGVEAWNEWRLESGLTERLIGIFKSLGYKTEVTYGAEDGFNEFEVRCDSTTCDKDVLYVAFKFKRPFGA